MLHLNRPMNGRRSQQRYWFGTQTIHQMSSNDPNKSNLDLNQEFVDSIFSQNSVSTETSRSNLEHAHAARGRTKDFVSVTQSSPRFVAGFFVG